MTIVTLEADNAVVVPNSVFTYSANPSTVEVLKNGVSTPVAVQTGVTDGASTQIVSGLQPGDVVVTGASAPQKAIASTPTRELPL